MYPKIRRCRLDYSQPVNVPANHVPASTHLFFSTRTLIMRRRITPGMFYPLVVKCSPLKCFICVCAPLLSKPFPIGDRVTFSGKDCVCQQCSHTLIKPNEPIKIHGPSRKSGVLLALSAPFRVARRCSVPSLMPHACI